MRVFVADGAGAALGRRLKPQRVTWTRLRLLERLGAGPGFREGLG
ncbi:hypothetical protein ABZ837_39575 [Streptomyces sp. NPDC047197]